MILDIRSENNLVGVHPDLVKIVYKANEYVDSNLSFIVTEGARTIEKQKELYRAGATQVLKSRHIPECNECKMSCAVDLAARVNGVVRWDWPLYNLLSIYMKRAAKYYDIDIEWGGDWKTFKDGPHFQLLKSQYPASS